VRGAARKNMGVMTMGERREKLVGVRKLIGERMLQSSTEIPQVSGIIKIDVTDLLALSQTLRKSGAGVSMTSLIAKAMSVGLAELPSLNSRLEGEEIVYYDNINLGVAASAPQGLLVVVLKDLQNKGLFEIDKDFRELMGRVQTKKLTMDDITGSTVTLSNLSKEKLSGFNSIINNNECILIGIGGIAKEAAVLPDGSIGPRDTFNLMINMNHTIVDGMSAAKYLERMQYFLEHPAESLLTDEERRAYCAEV